ncbi:IST1 [Araneus ventricosus]|uniref:IST1 homolog n=1 Tax=Araneus ventricosus TaxID=182803 RepID=A0A4Y2VW32_ARAVE|nr:IST1 [Araneus ventricosus]
MIKIGPKYVKLKTALQLACQRLKILQAKKMELSQKMQKEIANHLDNGKFMSAKIKVQTVIRYEADQEAMEIIQMLCEQILDRYGLFEKKKELDPSLVQAVSSLIWVSPYMRSEIVELKDIFKQLSVKYGSGYSKSALKNKQLTVNPELIERIKLNIPSEDKIQEYLRYIARKHSVPEDKKIEMEVYFSKSDSSESKRIGQNIDLVESTRFSSASNGSVTMEDVEDSETFEGCGNSVHDASVSCKKVFSSLKFVKNKRPRIRWTRNFFRKNTLPDIPEENEDVETENSLHDQDHGLIQKINGNDDDSVNKGETISGSVSGRHHMFGTLNENSENISDCRNKEVPPAAEIRSNFLLSAYKKKCNLSVKVPTIYETDSALDSVEDEKQNISKKTEYSDLIPGYTPMNDFENNPTYTDFERPPSYEEVVCNTTEDNLDVSHPYRFEVDIKLERFPQYPILPTCPTLDDMSEERFDSTGSSRIGGNSEKDGKTYSDRKKIPT